MPIFYVGQTDYITQLNILASTALLPIVTDNSGKFLTTDGFITSWESLPAPYSLPTASTTTLGGVKIDGTTITISNGVISGFNGSFANLTNKPTTLAGYGITDSLTATSINTAIGVETTRATAAEALKAPIASPTFTGIPLSTTATSGTNTTQIATTAFVQTAVSNLVASAPAALDTLNELATALGNDANFATSVSTAIGLKAPIASPTFTGTATIPTLNLTNALGVAYGGTGLTTAPANGALDIGNGTGFTRTTLTAGSGITITNAAGSITIATTFSGSSTVAGSNTQIQFNNSGVFGASANLTWDGSKVTASAYQTGGNLTFTGTGNRITGDMTNATIANRLAFQTSTVNGVTNFHIIPNGTSTSSGLKIEGDSSIANGSRFTFDLVGGVDCRINSSQIGTGIYLPMTLYTGGSERVRVDIGGKLLVGTSSVLGAAADAVQILQASNSGIAIGTSTAPTSGTSIAGINAYGNDSSTYTVGGTINFRAAENWSTTNHGTVIQFRVTASGSGGTLAEAMRIDSSSNVGIGTTSPVSKLQVTNSLAITNASGYQFLLMGNQDSSGTNKPTIIRSANAGLQFGIGDSWSSSTGGTFTPYLNIGSTGNVGIGTNAPAAKLHVAGDITGVGDLTLYRSGAPTTGYIYWGNTGTKYMGFDGSNIVASVSPAFSITGNAATATTTTNWGTYGAVPAAGSNASTANTIPRSDANGYSYFGYINSNTANSEAVTVSQVIVTNGSDNFYRKVSIANLTGFVQSNASGNWGINITGNAGSATTAGKTSATTVPASTAFSKWMFATSSTSGTLDWNDASNTIPGVGPTLLLGSATNGPSANNYYHPFNIEYADINGTGNVTQMAIAYGSPGNELYMRGRYSGGWSSWTRFLNSGNYNSYSPTLTGTGASGNWSINAAALQGLTTGASGSIYTDVNWSYLIQGFTTGGAFGWRATSATSVAFSCTAAGAFSATTYNGFTPSATSGTTNRLVATDANGYIFNNYFNSTDNAISSGVTAIMSKQGDNYYRSASAAAVATFISGQSFNTTGTATGLNGSNYITSTGSSGNYNTDFQNTPAYTLRYNGDSANITNSPGGTWWFIENMRHSNSSNHWGTQIAWGWEDNANRLATRNVSGGSFGGWVYYLNSNNYNSYAPTLTGGGASGTWGINISGNAATVTGGITTSNYTTYAVKRTGNIGNADLNSATYYNGSQVLGYNTATNRPGGEYGTMISINERTDTCLQMVVDYSTGFLYTRGIYTGGPTFSAWQTQLSSGNYNSYAPTLTGGGASGTWGISITGNAANVTGTVAVANGGTGQTTGYKLFDATFTSSIDANVNRTAGMYGSYASAATNTPTNSGILYNFMSGTGGAGDGGQFWQDYASDNLYLRKRWGGGFGGWFTMLSAGNYNSYAPTLTGGGASGTWGINISGNAANITAYTVNQSVGTGNAPTFYGVYSNNWFRSNNATGWYNETYAVGIWATEASNVRTYNNANFIAGGNVTAYSDERVKTNWRNLAPDFIKNLAELKSGIYDRTDTELTQVGVGAQSLQKFLPEAILVHGEGELSVAYGNAAMVSAVELAKRIVEQEARIARLEALVSKLIKE